MAASRTVRTMGPCTDVSFQPSILRGPMGTRPNETFIPKQPVHDAGMRMLPPPSDAVQNGTCPAATAAEEPPLEPPGVRSGFQGLRVTPKIRFLVKAV